MGGTMSSVVRRRLKTLLRRKEERDLAGLPSTTTTLPPLRSEAAFPSPQPSVVSVNDNDEAALNKGARHNGYSDGVL